MTKEEFRAIQARLGITNAELAQALGYSLSLISKYRAGAVEIRPLVAREMRRMDQEKGDAKTTEGER